MYTNQSCCSICYCYMQNWKNSKNNDYGGLMTFLW